MIDYIIGATLYVTVSHGDMSLPLLKVVVTVTTTFSTHNLKFFTHCNQKGANLGLKCVRMHLAAGLCPDPLGEL